MRAVAEAAGVAMSSVSRVLSGHPDVSEAMRTRVLTAVEQLDYKPDMLAQGLRRRETMTVGFVVGDISNFLFSQLVKGAEHALRQAGYSMLLTNSLFDPELDRRHIELLSSRRVDGLLLLPISETHEGMLDALRRLSIPIVVLERELPDSVPASRVFSDHRAGVVPAVEHLLDLGHRRIAMIAGQSVRPTRERAAALRECYDGRGLARTFEVLEGSYSDAHGYKVARRLLARKRPPTAIVATGNQIMRGALSAIAERGIRLGEELSFVGCDDLDLARLYSPRIAILERDAVALGRAAAELLLGHLRGGIDERQTIVQPTSFIPGPSCGPAPEALPAIAANR
ncbi:MAG: LacI family DNA-binding transcriptional regulator [Solirubrobacteraceae bacterium]